MVLEEYKEVLVGKIQEDTPIIATEKNVELITTFFRANSLIPGVEISTYRKVLISSEDENCVINEKYYNAICIKYAAEDTHIGILLLNLSAKHHGLSNMLIDYLLKLSVYPITMNITFTKPVTIADINDNFIKKVVPKLKQTKSKTIPVRKSYVEPKGV